MFAFAQPYNVITLCLAVYATVQLVIFMGDPFGDVILCVINNEMFLFVSVF